MSRGQVSGRTKENKTLTLMTTNWPVNLSLIYFLVTSAMVRASYRISSFSFLKRSRKASLPMFMHKTSKMIIYNISTSIGNRLTARNPTKSCQKSYKILFKFEHGFGNHLRCLADSNRRRCLPSSTDYVESCWSH